MKLKTCNPAAHDEVVLDAQHRFCGVCGDHHELTDLELVGHAWLCHGCHERVPPSYIMLAGLIAPSVDKLVDAIDRLTEAVEDRA